ncbi:hypothetical protein FA15DRAFT_704985 [Coprinopsis marcescibilis]|uniref:Nephrocystin 3-like N-terminal domain-containing protein n=1 Tax=Coprinopsis marcescibilis TaxID=230819 RepID=A0A5C3KU69_COPMA|nr:hypothetical protein FA15DRAFT_704985 [Coprinopsis marcescibilis]
MSLDWDQYTAPGAAHDSHERFPPPQCHPATRERALRIIIAWAKLPRSERLKRVLWLHAPAGMGKSAIAQTIAEQCEELAQLCDSIPELVPHIEAVIRSSPAILTKSLPLQLKRMVIDPLSKIPLIDEDQVVIIDGLDECLGPKPDRVDPSEEQQLVLKLIDTLVSSDLPLSFLVCCRAESWIQDGFKSLPDLWRCTEVLKLCQHSDMDSDIETYFRTEFERIREKSALPLPWPSQDELGDLIRKASGQFIYASTVIRYVDDPWNTPTDRLNVVLSSQLPADHNPLEALDNLYLTILNRSPKRSLTMEVVGCLKSSTEVIYSWDTRCFPNRSLAYLVDVVCKWPRHALRGLHSLIRINGTAYQSPFFHGTFTQFLEDPTRSKQFHAPLDQHTPLLASKCLSYLVTRSIDSNSSSDIFDTMTFASRVWDNALTLRGPVVAAATLRSPGVLDALLSRTFPLGMVSTETLHKKKINLVLELQHSECSEMTLSEVARHNSHLDAQFDQNLLTRLEGLQGPEQTLFRRIIDVIFQLPSSAEQLPPGSEIFTRWTCLYFEGYNVGDVLISTGVGTGHRCVALGVWPDMRLEVVPLQALILLRHSFIEFMATKNRSGPSGWHIAHESQLENLFIASLTSLLPHGFRLHDPVLDWTSWFGRSILALLPFITRPESVLSTLKSFYDNCRTLRDGPKKVKSLIYDHVILLTWEYTILRSIFNGNVTMASALLDFVHDRFRSANALKEGGREEAKFWAEVIGRGKWPLFEDFKQDPTGFIARIGIPRYISCAEDGCDNSPGCEMNLQH